MRLKRVESQSDVARWNRFAQTGYTGTTPYHRYEWRRIISAAYGWETDYLYIEDEKNEICALLPLCYMKWGIKSFGISLPYCTHAGIANKGDEGYELLLSELMLICLGRNLDYIELRQMASSDNPGSYKRVQILPLASEAGVQFSKISGNLRSHVRRAKKKGVAVRIGGRSDLDKWYPVYTAAMRRLGTPAHKKRLFIEVLERFKDDGVLLVSAFNKKVIGGMVIVKNGPSAHDPWVASLVQYNKYYTNDLMYWEAIKWAIENGCRYFDFGRSTPGSGVEKFKLKWGARSHSLVYLRLNQKGQVNALEGAPPRALKIAGACWPKLPPSIAERLGGTLRKFIP